jgi:hypothetical protein
VGIDNPNAPTRATCGEPTCNRQRAFPPGLTRRQAENDLAANGWWWEADHETVHAFCPDHSTEPVRKARGSKR